jgi:hypothetical protein
MVEMHSKRIMKIKRMVSRKMKIVTISRIRFLKTMALNPYKVLMR